jgi:predicted NUDIX family phosphoesterase
VSQVLAEQVLVVPTPVFHRLGHFQGFCADADRYLAEFLKPENVSYRPRAEMEQDPTFKQLIPYCIFRHRDAAGRASIFQYVRGKGQGEGRLHSKRSVGIGGHISVEDATAKESATGAGHDPYREGLRRELAEEVYIDAPFTEQCVGLINDDESEVGRVHLGIVHIFDVERPAVRSREVDLIESGFAPVSDLLADLSGFETWSAICLRALFA